ncbi:MAG: AsnC family transcriptional regulator [Candidatus Hodarchaeales archaeon]|jgi:DNA-binding Lrp family transcriptional regulator
MKLADSLDLTDLELIILLQEKPIANYSSIAKLLSLSSPTVKRRIDRLYSKVINRIVAIPRYSKLNLMSASCFLEIGNYNNFTQVEKLIDLHPYLYFRVRTYGDLNGVHATFRIPEGGINFLSEFINKLEKLKLIENYLFFQHKDDITVRSTPRFSAYTSKTGSWEFSWQKWIETPQEKLSRVDPVDKSSKTNDSLNKIEYLDLEILAQLSTDSRQKNVKILEKISSELSAQRLSDKLRELKQKYIDTYRVYLNWEVFDFTEVIFNVKTENDFFKQLLSTFPPPFQSTFRDYEEKNGQKGFIWYLSCPPSHVVDAFETLMKISKDAKLYLMNRKQQLRAPLNIKALDKKSMNWIISENYLISDLLTNIQQ